ncbi:MAG: recombinase family protein [Patescibacteria group bacterium]|nr:recombinase family protein [Patescibacteria group bacterium]
MKRAAILARVSTENQKEEATIESQVAEIKERVKQDGNILLDECIYKDEGYSGELLARPALDKMRDDAKKRNFNILYVYDRGRLSRKFAYQELILEELNDLDIDFVTLHDVKAETPEEKVLQAMQGVFHEYERIKITERFRRGKLYKVRNGNLLGYCAPYGYDYIPKTKEKNGSFIINPVEAEVVKKIFHWVAIENISLREVIKRLYKLNIPPKKQKRPIWTKGPIVRMLSNETYIGNHYYLKTEATVSKSPKSNGYHRVKKSSRKIRPREEWIKITVPAIIDISLFEKAQKQLELNKKFSPRNTKREYLLQGLIYCPCGQKRTGEGIKDHEYYRCTSRLHSFPLPSQCYEGGVNTKVVDTLVWNKIVEMLTNTVMIQKQAENWIKKRDTKTKTNDTGGIEKEIANLDKEQERYSIAYGKGIMPIEIYESRMAEIAEKRKVLEINLSEAKPKINIGSYLDPKKLAQIAIKTIKSFNFSDKKFIIRQLTETIVADKKLVVVGGHIPLTGLDMELYAKYRNSRTT